MSRKSIDQRVSECRNAASFANSLYLEYVTSTHSSGIVYVGVPVAAKLSILDQWGQNMAGTVLLDPTTVVASVETQGGSGADGGLLDHRGTRFNASDNGIVHFESLMFTEPGQWLGASFQSDLNLCHIQILSFRKNESNNSNCTKRCSLIFFPLLLVLTPPGNRKLDSFILYCQYDCTGRYRQASTICRGKNIGVRIYEYCTFEEMHEESIRGLAFVSESTLSILNAGRDISVT